MFTATASGEATDISCWETIPTTWLCLKNTRIYLLERLEICRLWAGSKAACNITSKRIITIFSFAKHGEIDRFVLFNLTVVHSTDPKTIRVESCAPYTMRRWITWTCCSLSARGCRSSTRTLQIRAHFWAENLPAATQRVKGCLDWCPAVPSPLTC